MGLPQLDVRESRLLELAPELPLRQGTGDAAGPLGHVAPGGFIHPGVGDDVGDREAASWPEHPRRFAKDRRLVSGEVDHAVGDHDVDRVVGQRHRFDRPLQELDIPCTRLPLVSAGHLKHLVGHVDAIRLAARSDPLGREQHVDAAARAQVEDGLSLVKLGDRRRIAAAERSELRLVGERVSVGLQIERRHRTPRPHMHPGRRHRSRTSPGSSLRPSRVRNRRRAPLPPSSPRRRSARAPPLGSRPCRSAQPSAQFLQ